MIDELEVTLRRIVADEIGDCCRRRRRTVVRCPMYRISGRWRWRSCVVSSICVRGRRCGWASSSSTPEEEDRITDRVLETAFSVSPGFDRLLQRADVTDIHINGCDDVRLGLVNG